LRNPIINLGDSFGNVSGGCEVDRQRGKLDYRTTNWILLVFGVFLIPFLLLWGAHRIENSSLKFGLSAHDAEMTELIMGLEALALMLAVTTFLVGFEVSRVASALTDWKDLQARSLDRLLQLNHADNLLPLPTTFKYQALETPFAPGQDNTARYMRMGIAAMGIVSSILLFLDIQKSGFVNLGLFLMQAVHIGICVIGCRIVQDSEKAHMRHLEYQPEVCYQEFEAAMDDYLKYRIANIRTNSGKRTDPFQGFTGSLTQLDNAKAQSKKRLEESIHRLDDSLPKWCWLDLVSSNLEFDFATKFQIERIRNWARETSKDDTYGTIAHVWCLALLIGNAGVIGLGDDDKILSELTELCLSPAFKTMLEYAQYQCATFEGGDIYIELTLHSLVKAWNTRCPSEVLEIKEEVEQHLTTFQILRRTRNRRPVGHHTGQRNAVGADLTGANLKGADLKGVYLPLVLASKADLTNANLFRANLFRANLRGANLRGAKFRRANLRGANLTLANLTDANLFRAYLTRANLTSADLTGADLRGADLTGAWSTSNGANLTRANLTRANLTRANLTGANLTGANLTGANLTGANLTGANLTGANLTRAWYTFTEKGPELTGAFFPLANLTDAYFPFVDLTGACFRFANLTRANLGGADLTRADLTRADLTGANLTSANLNFANLTGATVSEAQRDMIGSFIRPDGKWSSDS